MTTKANLLLLSLCAILSVVYATSDSVPSIIYLCDAMSTKYGCEPQFWTGGDRLKCKNTTQIMAWASKAVRSNCYEFVAGKEEAPVTTYNPDEITVIHLRVQCYGMLYRGLMVYAVDSTETKVGDWAITNEEPGEWKRPWDTVGDPCFGTLMHSSAEYKPYHSVLYFKAPPAGTGRITFRALIKHGNANTGAFYHPMEDLVLNENTTPKSNATFFEVSGLGQSCAEFCQQTPGYGCDEGALATLSDPTVFHNQVGDETVCVLPLLSGCGAQAGTYDPKTQYCYYPEKDCDAQNRPTATQTCSTKLADASRFCACSLASAMSSGLSTAGSTESSEEDEENAGSPIRVTSILTLFALLFIRPKAALVFLIFIAMSSAHNWINSQSRSNGASTYQPFKPAITDMPHAQVGPGQIFNIEWMTAHGSYTYFAFVHSKDQAFMQQNNAKLLEDYIKLAPAGALINATSGNFQRFHRKDNKTLDNDFPASSTSISVPNYFLRFVEEADPLYIPRDSALTGRVGGVGKPNNTNTYLVQYKPSELSQDVRVAYKSDKYPWLVAVYKFKHTAYQPVRPDVANFWFPAGAEYGRYLIQYLWSGYRDAVDIDYVPDLVTNIYGIKPNTSRWRRIDHCLFDKPRAVYDVAEVVTDARYCLRRCEARTTCWGVNVVPLQAPDTAYKFSKPDEDFWFFPNIYGTDIYTPWNLTAFTLWKDRLLANPAADKFICYTVQPADFTDTTDEYTVSKDPEDPIFYSTCYYRYLGNTFPGYEDTASLSVGLGPWRFNDKCIDCESQSLNLFAEVVPQWKVEDTCINCDKEPVTTVPPTFPVANLVEGRVRCDGTPTGSFARSSHHDNCTNTTFCVKQLMPIGRPTSDSITLDECYLLASREPSCSNTFQWAFNTTIKRCYCYTNVPCCKTCSRRTDDTMAVYQIKSDADPTCATGVKSADGLNCCSAECGEGNCVSSASSTVVSVGFCQATVTRPCSQYGPPCKL